MDQDVDRHQGAPAGSVRSGKIIVSGCAFLAVMVAWVYVVFVGELYAGGRGIDLLYPGLIIAHAVVGIGLLMRIRLFWFVGLAVAVLGVGMAIISQQFPLSGFDAIAGFLLFLSRTEFDPRPSDSPTAK
jgi:hypothetical protein